MKASVAAEWRAAAGAALALAGTLFVVSCTAEPPPPGDSVVGVFDFRLQLEDAGTCPPGVAEVRSPFTGTISVESRSGQAFLTIGTLSHEGSLLGSALDVSSRGSRIFAGCDCPDFSGRCPGFLDEQIQATLLGQVETAALGGFEGCARWDGGLPDGATGGRMDGGWDVRMICGRVIERLSAEDLQAHTCGDAGASIPCEASFSLSAWRH